MLNEVDCKDPVLVEKAHTMSTTRVDNKLYMDPKVSTLSGHKILATSIWLWFFFVFYDLF